MVAKGGRARALTGHNKLLLQILNPHPCHRLNALEQLSDRLKPATVVNLLIRCQKRSLLIISLFFNDKVTLLYS